MTVMAGFSRVDATPSWSVEMAGYPPIRSKPGGPQEHAVYKGRETQSTGSHLPIYVRSAVLGSDSEKIAIVALDICTVSAEFTDSVRTQLKQVTSIEWGNVFLCASHTHSGPDVCGLSSAPDLRTFKFFVEQTVNSIVDAWRGQQSCSVSFSKANVHRLTVNRRNPETPVDSKLSQIVFVKTGSNEIHGVVQSFACHPIIAGAHNTLLFGDYPTVLSFEVEKHLGGIAPCLFLQGPCGDVNPMAFPYEDNINLVTRAPSGSDEALKIRTIAEAERFGIILSNYAVEILSAKRKDIEGRVSGTSKSVKLKRRSLEDLDSYLFQRDHDPSRVKKWLSSEQVDSEIGAVAFGDLVIVFLPGEPLTAVADQIRLQIENSGREALIVGYCNDYPGYVVHPDEYDEVRYENAATVLAKEGVTQLMDEAVTLL